MVPADLGVVIVIVAAILDDDERAVVLDGDERVDNGARLKVDPPLRAVSAMRRQGVLGVFAGCLVVCDLDVLDDESCITVAPRRYGELGSLLDLVDADRL